MKQKIKKFSIAVVAVAVLVLLDQITKYLAVKHLNPANGGQDVIIWNGVFRLQYLENRGAAFGIMQGKKALLVLTTVLVFADLLDLSPDAYGEALPCASLCLRVRHGRGNRKLY